MPKRKPKRLKYRELTKRLKKYGIIVIINRGKGSERMLYRESTRDNYPITYHSANHQYSIGLLTSIKRRFDLPDEFLF